MERKEFIRDLGKGIVAYSVLPLGANLSNLPKPKEKAKKVVEADGIYRPEGYHLIWEDNFDGKSLDESEWFYRMDLKMNSAQRAENVSVKNGNLVLAMKKEDFLGMPYTGAGIVSKRRWQHGYFEVKAKLTHAEGWHHSFWTQQGTGFLTYAFDRFMEIDVFEMESTRSSNHNLWIHRDGWSSKKKNWSSVHEQDLGLDASDGYHIYGYEYTSEGLKFYVDGKNVHTINATEDDYKHYSMNLWLTVIATQAEVTADLPAYDYFDYIRCYSKDPDASLPPKVEPVPETGTTVYVDNYDPWGFNMGTYWEISTDGDAYRGKNYYKWKPGKTYNPFRDWALFRPLIAEDGNYDIYLRWPAGEDRSEKVPLEIWYDGGAKKDTTKSINQREHDGEWVKIGRYSFKKGWNNMIKLIAMGPGYTVADAAKFVKA
ncbi:glycoside hydrolase family 16 protein [Compostibacter hankyongensis]|uniref:GH16 domain-containing protein n=1 Tax=Compostibacter hankyongensis TaxID=1007089 RepID=A0ABP8FGX8_9BACT